MEENRELDLEALAKIQGCRTAQFARLFQLNYPAPDIITAIFDAHSHRGSTGKCCQIPTYRPIGPCRERLTDFRHLSVRLTREICLVGTCGRDSQRTNFEKLSVPPNFGLHQLTGDRRGSCSLTVTRNWRMTFGLNDEGALIDMDLEDYYGA